MRRIGVFDSVIGGLTVLRQLRRAFPQLDMVYLGDTARVPYGGRSVETITHYAEDDVRFLLRKDVEAIVIACGTVSSNSLDALREKFDLPIYGVIESAARLAASMTKTRSVGVIGTQATVKSGAYETHIRAIDPGVHVVSRACPLFVPLVENGFISRDCEITRLMCRHYLAEMKAFSPDVLILGCTHFPIISEIIADFMPDVALVDPAKEAAHELLHVLNAAGIASDSTHGDVKYFVSDAPERFSANAWIFLGGENEIKANKVEL